MNRKLRKVMYILFGLLLLALLPILYLTTAKVLLSKKPVENRVNYLRNHMADISLDIPDDHNIEIISGNGDVPNVYVFGETHGFSATQPFDLLFLKYLNGKMGVRHYFAELYSEDAENISTFLNSTQMDISRLCEVLLNVKNHIPQQFTREYFEKWISLYHFNSTLPPQKKIIVHGLLGNSSDDSANKDSVMYHTFISSINKIEEAGEHPAAYYCSTGMMHALRSPIRQSDNILAPFASRIDPSEFMVISVVHLPLNCNAYFPRGHGYPVFPNQTLPFLNAGGPIFYYPGIENLDNVSSHSGVKLFRLDCNDSPYSQGVDLVGYRSPLKFIFGDLTAVSGKVTTDYFNYVLLTRGLSAPMSFENYESGY